MSETFLRGRDGSTIGIIQTSSNGTQVIRDKAGIVLGEYSSSSNLTREANGSLVGTGNLLTSLLRQ